MAMRLHVESVHTKMKIMIFRGEGLHGHEHMNGGFCVDF